MSEQNAEIYYYDIGDYLSREQKLDIITNFKGMENLPFTRLKPNEHGDWISQRNDKFGTWIQIEPTEKFSSKSQTWFSAQSCGILTAKDTFLYNLSKKKLSEIIQNMVDFYNVQREKFQKTGLKDATAVLDYNSSKISWSDLFIRDLQKNVVYKFDDTKLCEAYFRPFIKQNFIYDKQFIQRTYQQLSLFPKYDSKNLVICVSGIGVTKEFSAIITNIIPDYELIGKSQCFPLYWYETIEPEQNSLFGDDAQIVKHEAVSDFILERAQSKYGNKVQREDIFRYVVPFVNDKPKFNIKKEKALEIKIFGTRPSWYSWI